MQQPGLVECPRCGIVLTKQATSDLYQSGVAVHARGRPEASESKTGGGAIKVGAVVAVLLVALTYMGVKWATRLPADKVVAGMSQQEFLEIVGSHRIGEPNTIDQRSLDSYNLRMIRGGKIEIFGPFEDDQIEDLETRSDVMLFMKLYSMISAAVPGFTASAQRAS
jgi:hypothetical protein